MQWETIWEVSSHPGFEFARFAATNWGFFVFPPLMLITGRHLVRRDDRYQWHGMILLLMGAMFSLWLAVETLAFARGFLAANTGRYVVTEGRIENFTGALDKGILRTPEGNMLPGRSASFTVNGKLFAYHRMAKAHCFHGSVDGGELLRNGLHVRIHHRNGCILRLEIRVGGGG